MSRRPIISKLDLLFCLEGQIAGKVRVIFTDSQAPNGEYFYDETAKVWADDPDRLWEFRDIGVNFFVEPVTNNEQAPSNSI